MVPAQSAPPRSHRTVVLGGIATALALIGVVVAVVLITRGSSSPTASVAAFTPPRQVTVTAPATPETVTVASATSSTMTAADMQAVLQRYVDAYSNEDVAALRSLFAVDFVRKNGSDPFEDRSQALETYRSQFANLTNPSYSLKNITYEPGHATVVAAYSITSDAGTVGGRIAYHFVRDGDRLLIDELVIRPS